MNPYKGLFFNRFLHFALNQKRFRASVEMTARLFNGANPEQDNRTRGIDCQDYLCKLLRTPKKGGLSGRFGFYGDRPDRSFIMTGAKIGIDKQYL